MLVCAFFFVGLGADSKPLNDDKPPVEESPHVIIIFVDDMGYGDLQSYNQESKIKTPNIDSLARQGMLFTDAHAPGAVCVPSRYGLLTGRYPFRTDVSVWPDEPVIDEDRMTIASLLQSEGYRTAMVGKWHLGFDESAATKASDEGANTRTAFREYEEPLPGGPVDRGFDRFFGIRASTDIPPYFYIQGDQPVEAPTDTIGENRSPDWSPIQGKFWREGGIAPGLELIDVLPRFTEEAKGVIYDHDANHPESPLMLYLALPAPHTPWLPTEAYEGRSEVGLYGDFMEMVDAKVGEVLHALEETGMAEQSLVIFASDNGPVWYERDSERFGHDSRGGLRGMKGDAHEGGHRMPFIVRWPGKVAPGSVSSQTISFTDVLATLAGVVGTSLPDDAGEDSFDLLPVFLGEQPEEESIRPPVVSISSRGVRAIQDGQWKLIEGLGSGGFTDPARVEPGPGDPEGQLYNLAEDPEESRNLWNEHPEEVERLEEMLERYDQEGRSR